MELKGDRSVRPGEGVRAIRSVVGVLGDASNVEVRERDGGVRSEFRVTREKSGRLVSAAGCRSARVSDRAGVRVERVSALDVRRSDGVLL